MNRFVQTVPENTTVSNQQVRSIISIGVFYGLLHVVLAHTEGDPEKMLPYILSVGSLNDKREGSLGRYVLLMLRMTM